MKKMYGVEMNPTVESPNDVYQAIVQSYDLTIPYLDFANHLFLFEHKDDADLVSTFLEAEELLQDTATFYYLKPFKAGALFEDYGFMTNQEYVCLDCDTTIPFFIESTDEIALQMALFQLNEHIIGTYCKDESIYLIDQTLIDLVNRYGNAYQVNIHWIYDLDKK